jgi:hypothetical protein
MADLAQTHEGLISSTKPVGLARFASRVELHVSID